MSSRPTAIPLRTQITLLVCGVVLVALAATGLAVTARVEGRTREALVEKAAMAATLAAEARPVVEGLEGRAPQSPVAPSLRPARRPRPTAPRGACRRSWGRAGWPCRVPLIRYNAPQAAKLAGLCCFWRFGYDARTVPDFQCADCGECPCCANGVQR